MNGKDLEYIIIEVNYPQLTQRACPVRGNAAWTGVERLYPSFLRIFLMQFTAQFRPTLKHGVSFGGVR